MSRLPTIHTPLPQPLDVLLADLGIVLLPCWMLEISLMHTTNVVMTSMIAVVEDRRSAHLRRVEAVSSQQSRMGWRARRATRARAPRGRASRARVAAAGVQGSSSWGAACRRGSPTGEPRAAESGVTKFWRATSGWSSEDLRLLPLHSQNS